MAVSFADGVVVGADSRTTTGSYIGKLYVAFIQHSPCLANRVTDKLTQIHDRIFCCRSGSAADTQAIADIVHYYLQLFGYARYYLGRYSNFSCRVQEETAPTVENAAKLFHKLVYENKNGLMAGIIIGGIVLHLSNCSSGWDPVHGPGVYSINLGGSCHKKPFSIGGSGSSYIYGYCDANYKEGMTKEECVQFTKNC